MTTQPVDNLSLLNEIYLKYGKQFTCNRYRVLPFTKEELRLLLTDEDFCNPTNPFYIEALYVLPMEERIEFVFKYGSNKQVFSRVAEHLWKTDVDRIPDLIKLGVGLFVDFLEDAMIRTLLLPKRELVSNWILDELLKYYSANAILSKAPYTVFKDPSYLIFHPEVNKVSTRITSACREYRLLTCYIVLNKYVTNIQLPPWDERVWSALQDMSPAYLNKFAQQYPEGLSWLEKRSWFVPTKTIQKILDKRNKLRALTGG